MWLAILWKSIESCSLKCYLELLDEALLIRPILSLTFQQRLAVSTCPLFMIINSATVPPMRHPIFIHEANSICLLFSLCVPLLYAFILDVFLSPYEKQSMPVDGHNIADLMGFWPCGCCLQRASPLMPILEVK